MQLFVFVLQQAGCGLTHLHENWLKYCQGQTVQLICPQHRLRRIFLQDFLLEAIQSIWRHYSPQYQGDDRVIVRPTIWNFLFLFCNRQAAALHTNIRIGWNTVRKKLICPLHHLRRKNVFARFPAGSNTSNLETLFSTISRQWRGYIETNHMKLFVFILQWAGCGFTHKH